MSDTKARGKVREAAHEKAAQQVTLFGRELSWGDIIRFGGLIVFFAVMVAAVALVWPHIHLLFEEEGRVELIHQVRGNGAKGVLILLLLQLLQVIVAWIPGEVVQIVAGLIYGPFGGMLIILAGCVLSSILIFALVHKLGAPFVQSMVSTKWLDKLEGFEQSGKLRTTVFVLFLIPGIPKDTLTYLVPLTNMPMREFVLTANIARIPGVATSTFAAASLARGDYLQAFLLFCVAAAIAIVVLLFKDKLMALLDERKES